MIRRIAPIVLASLAFASSPAPSPAATYTVDASHTSVIFAVSHLGYSYTYGRFNRVGGEFSYAVEAPASSRFVLTIDAASLDTNDAKRDDHLRGADFFNVKQFPKLTFRTTSVTGSAEELQVTGEFSLHGVTKTITVPLQVLGQGKGPYGKDRVGFLSQFSIQRSDFGMTKMMGPIGDDVSVIISFEGIRQ